jgi:hypothetical protein
LQDVSPINGYFAEAFRSALSARAVASETLASGNRLLTTFALTAEDGLLEGTVLSAPGPDGADSVHPYLAVDLGVAVPEKNLPAARHFSRVFRLLNQPFGLVVDGDEALLTHASVFYPGGEAVFPALLTALGENVEACRAALRRIVADDLSEADAEAAAFILRPFAAKENDDA